MPVDLAQFRDPNDLTHANDDVWIDALIEILPMLKVSTTHIAKENKTIKIHFANGLVFTVPDFTVVQPDDVVWAVNDILKESRKKDPTNG